MLPGANIRNVFASRWKALYWSLGVMLTAYCTIPAADPDSNASAPGETKVAASAQPQGRKDPWARSGAAHDYVKSGQHDPSRTAGYFDNKAVEIREKIH